MSGTAKQQFRSHQSEIPPQEDTKKYTTVPQNALVKVSEDELRRIHNFWTVANYMSVAQIYLQDNFIMEKPLAPEHIKARLLGHWGTCPGLNFVYTHCNYMIKKHDLDMLFVVGPGHGNPAILSCLFLEGCISHYYPNYPFNREGFDKIIRYFSWPTGFPSHINAELPGTIHEGGELGYSLGVAYGAVMDNPNLIVTCVVGDGEAETGPLHASWNGHKFLDPKESGAVIPVLHLNGFKISSRTVLSCMSDEDLYAFFKGFGYNARIVTDESENPHMQMIETMEWALSEIRNIQNAARSGKPIFRPHWPMIILRTPKGWGVFRQVDGEDMEGSFRSHQVPVKDAKNHPKHLKNLEDWLKSYHIEQFLDPQTGFLKKEITDMCPTGTKRMGNSPYAFVQPKALITPKIRDFMVDLPKAGAADQVKMSTTEQSSKYLAEIIKNNYGSFRIFSPDELESNKFGAVLKATNRNFNWGTPEESNRGGALVEVLSEHTCQSFMQGYCMTGRYALFPSYEAFLGIVATMMQQYAKFKKMGSEVKWRLPTPSLNYIETSTLYRQEHNGFSHQNPGFINSLINLKSSMTRVYLPADANCMVSVIDHCVRSKDYVNLIITSKLDTPVFLSKEEAINHCSAGASVWKQYSTDDGLSPDVVIVGCGVETTIEAVAAAMVLRQEVPDLRVRVVNVVDLMILGTENSHPHGLSDVAFESLFTKDKPVIFNFHGYPSAVKQLLFGRQGLDRFHVNGYLEEGTTTTPFDILTSNKCSRFDIAIQVLERCANVHPRVSIDAHLKIALFEKFIREHKKYIFANGADPEFLQNIQPPKDIFCAFNC